MANNYNTDIYNLASLITDIEKEYTQESEDTLSVGIYGYFNAIFRKMMYNQIKLSSELSNEVFPTRARFDRNVLAHAVFNNITDINATPAFMNILICIPEEEFDKFLEINNTTYFILSKDCKINIEEYEFHLDYDIKIYKKKILNNQTVFTAMYDMSEKSQLNDEVNPYLPSPFIMNYNNIKYIYISCTIRQVERDSIIKKTINDNRIMNKTLDFTFENQLACFDIYATDGDEKTHIVPIMEGTMLSDLDLSKNKYCYYTFIDTSKIRVKFEPSQYIPTLNSELEIVVQTCKGAEGTFTYNKELFITLDDEKYQYDGMQVIVIPQEGKSKNGADKKTISEIKKLTQKQALSRGVISMSKDLNNYLNNLNTDDTKVQIQEKIHNQFNRSFYAYIVLRDNLNNIIPTNTINALIDETKFVDYINKDENNNKLKLVIKQGSYVGMKFLEESGWVAEILPESTEEELLKEYKFLYSLPFMSVITYSGPFMSFFGNVMKTYCNLSFTYINDISPIQFIAVNFAFERNYNTTSKNGKYVLSLQLTQNINEDMGVLEFIDEEENNDEDSILDDEIQTYSDNELLDKIKENNLRVIMVLYNKENVPYRYMEAKLVSYDYSENYKYIYEIEFNTSDKLDENNYIRVENTYQPGTNNEVYGYYKPTLDVDIYVLNKFKDDNGDIVEFGRDKLDNIVPGLEGYTVTNKYSSIDGLSFFTNYSEIMSVNTTPLSTKNGDSVDGFRIEGLPVISYEYSKTEEQMQSFMSSLKNTRDFIDNTLYLLENQIGIDFKFFNTYGPSNIYYLDSSYSNRIDRVNISILFEVKLKTISDKNTKDNIAKDIKKLLEDIDNIGSIHIPNIITSITNSYSSLIEYIEFKSIDEYGPGYQHIYRKDPEETYTVPEMLTINNKDGKPDITIRIV